MEEKMFVPFTKVPVMYDGSFTIPGALFMLAAGGTFWWVILWLLYPPAVIIIYLVWSVGYGSMALTGTLWLIVTKVMPAIRRN